MYISVISLNLHNNQKPLSINITRSPNKSQIFSYVFFQFVARQNVIYRKTAPIM